MENVSMKSNLNSVRKSVFNDSQYVQATASQIDTVQQSSVLLAHINQKMDNHTE